MKPNEQRSIETFENTIYGSSMPEEITACIEAGCSVKSLRQAYATRTREPFPKTQVRKHHRGDST